MDEARYHEILQRLGVDPVGARNEHPGGRAGAEEPELARRVVAFRRQVEEWVREGRLGVPLLTLPDAPAPRLRQCVSCGAGTSDECWRCSLCLRAVEIVLGLPHSEAAP